MLRENCFYRKNIEADKKPKSKKKKKKKKNRTNVCNLTRTSKT